jgi:DNA polymerase-3 subunit epsilon
MAAAPLGVILVVVSPAQARREAAYLARVRLKAGPWYLDTETTGLGPRDEIIEVCLLDPDGQVQFESLVRPTGPIPMDAVGLHGITDAMVEAAPHWADVWPQLRDSMKSRSIAVYNADFDARLLRQTQGIHGLPESVDTSGFFCLMQLYAQFRGDWDGSRRSFRWHSLEAARRQVGLDLPNAHRARDDALLARALLHAMASSA